MNREEVILNDIVYYRYPQSNRRDLRVYFRPNGTLRAKGYSYLHREIWKATHGEILENHVIHHVDGDPLNNNIENLECVPKGEHTSHHMVELMKDPEFNSKIHKNLEKARKASKVWHRSEEGREFHRRIAPLATKAKKVLTKECQDCGAEYKTVIQRSTFCSRNCKASARRKSGVDNEIRVCEYCNKEFSVGKYLKKIYCNRECSSRCRRS